MKIENFHTGSGQWFAGSGRGVKHLASRLVQLGGGIYHG